MTYEEGIEVTGRVIEVLGNSSYRAELPNGKIVNAFPSEELRRNPSRTFKPGDRVTLKMTPYDFSKAKITGLENF